MSIEKSTVTVRPLDGSNFATWKVQCQMALMKEGLWSIVNDTETAPDAGQAEKYAKFIGRRDRALATIVLSLDPSLLYLLDDPKDPVNVWKKLTDQFQKKTWANKLELRRKLYSLRMNNGDSVQSHIKEMTEIFNNLSVIGDAVSEDDRVVYLLASLPDSYNMLVTALESNADVPKMELVTERLLHEERKLKGKADVDEKVMVAGHKYKKKGPKCYKCGKHGHIKRDCKSGADKSSKHQANAAGAKQSESSDGESVGLVMQHTLLSHSTNTTWLVDSGATCHMCHDKNMFAEYESLNSPLKVTVGDGNEVDGVGRGVVLLNSVLPSGRSRSIKLHNVLHVPRLAYNLFSVSAATERDKTVKFGKVSCRILDKNNLIAIAVKVGELYYLKCRWNGASVNAAETRTTNEELWHRRFGHLGVRNLQKLAREELVNAFDYDKSREIGFCQPCVEGKLHKSPFPDRGKRAKKPLALVHSDVCGKMSTQSLSGGLYFLSFIDDYTRFVWVYILKTKDQVFQKFLEWKALVENGSGRKVKTFRTDNGGEYTSTEFETYLKKEGVRHELTVAKTPQQNGVAERMNRTLVETVRSMLSDSKLPKRFWAEALSTAVYLRNRSPTRAVDGMTPFEAWNNVKPDVGHLRVFGCLCYAHIPKDERQKLDVKARKCIMLGYGTETKAYRLYDVERSKVVFSRDVVFNEAKNGIEKEPASSQSTQDSTRYVQLDSAGVDDLAQEGEQIPQEQVPQEQEPGLRRSTRERRQTNFYTPGATCTVADIRDPLSRKEALDSGSSSEWVNAMEKEMESLLVNEVWDLVELPKDRKAVGSKWVFKTKRGANGAVERHKARLVAQGYSQQYGQDYDETFSPVVRFESLRTVIAFAVHAAWFRIAPNGCDNSISEWRAQGGSIHETTRRLRC